MADKGGLRLADAFVALSTRGESGVVSSIDTIKERLLGLPAEFSAGEIIAGHIKEFAAESIEAWEQNELAVARLNTVLAATGGAAGYTGTQLEEMAGNLQELTGFNTTNIERAMSQMARFTNVRGDTFFKGMEAASDLAAQNASDLESAVVAVGRALEDPKDGMMMLQRYGVQITEAEREHIQALTESGDIIDAQAIILEKLRGTVGGVAQALRTPTQDLSNAMEDLKVSVGEGLGPAFDGVKSVLASMVNLAHELLQPFLTLGGVVGSTIGSWLKDLAEDLRTIAGGFKELWDIAMRWGYGTEEGKPNGVPKIPEPKLAAGQPAQAGPKKPDTDLYTQTQEAQRALDEMYDNEDKKISDRRKHALRGARTDFDSKYGNEAGYDVIHGAVHGVEITPKLFEQLDQFAQRFGVEALKSLLAGGEAAEKLLAPYRQRYGSDAMPAMLAGKSLEKPKKEVEAEQAVELAKQNLEWAQQQADGEREAKRIVESGKRPDENGGKPADVTFSAFDQFAKSLQSGLSKRDEDKSGLAAAQATAANTKNTVEMAREQLELAKQQLEAIKRIKVGLT